MKRTVMVISALTFLIFSPFTALAGDELSEEKYNEELGAYDLSFFKDELDGETYSVIEELGLDGFGLDSLTSLSYEKVMNIIKGITLEKLKSPLEGALGVLVFIFLSSLFQSLKSDSSDMGELYSTVSALVIATVLISKISTAVALSVSSVKIASDFVFAFVPVFFAIVMASGGITASFSTNTMLLILAQSLSLLASNVFVPVINSFLAIGICSGLRSQLNLSRVTESLKRIITSTLSFSAGAFVSVLSIKTSISARADMLGIRSLRFVINSVVPVVGGALSEGLLSVQGYSSLIKSSVGLVGIIAIAFVFLPAIIEVLLWRLVLGVCAIVCDVFNDKSVSLVICAFKDTMLLINVVLIISALTTVISFGILIAAGG